MTETLSNLAVHRPEGMVGQAEAEAVSARRPSRSHPSRSDWCGRGLIKAPSKSPNVGSKKREPEMVPPLCF
jgi:hypothetical protein